LIEKEVVAQFLRRRSKKVANSPSKKRLSSNNATTVDLTDESTPSTSTKIEKNDDSTEKKTRSGSRAGSSKTATTKPKAKAKAKAKAKKGSTKRKSSAKSKKAVEEDDEEKTEDDNGDKDTNGDKEFNVESISQEKTENGVKKYLVKWEGYLASQSTWEPEENLAVYATPPPQINTHVR
jgi:hypothetical protein